MISISDLLSLLVLVLLLVYYLSKRKFDYWKKKKVPFVQPLPLFGNFKDYILLRRYEGHIAQEICHAFPDAPYVGGFFGTEPMLLVKDLELIKLVMTKDFYYFHGRAISRYIHNEVFTQSLFFTYGDQWRVMRQNLTPLFSSAKMRNMFYLIEKSATTLKSYIDEIVREDPNIETRSLMVKYTMDCIGSCAFGINTDTMSDDTKSNPSSNPFLTIGSKIFEISTNRDLKVVGRTMWPAIFYGMGFKLFPLDLDVFFKKLLTGVFESRSYQPSSKHDFVDLVLNLKKNNYLSGDSIHNMVSKDAEKIHLAANDDMLVGQCIGIFAAGFETSSSSLTFTLYELAKNQEAQSRAIAEVDDYLSKHNGKIGYECVTETPYLEACISEALRLYPVLGVITREVMKEYTFPDGLKLDKGVRVHIPAYYLHHHPGLFPEPEKYRPERFMPEERDGIKPYSVLSFGDGARICIGIRFAKMQMLPGLITILSGYRVELAEGTPTTLELEPASLVTQPRGGIRLKFVPRF